MTITGIPDGYHLLCGPKLVAGLWMHEIPPAQWQDIQELCTRHGQNPCGVHALEYAEIDLPLIAFTIFDQNEDGHRFIKPGTDEAATHTVDVALRGALPLWWRVDFKLTAASVADPRL